MNMSSQDSSSESVSSGKAETFHGLQRRLRWLSWGLLVVAVLFVAHLVYAHIEIGGLRAELAKRLQSGDDASLEAKTIARTTQDMMVDLQAKVANLENRQSETQNQQVSLSQMYQDLSKSRDAGRNRAGSVDGQSATATFRKYRRGTRCPAKCRQDIVPFQKAPVHRDQGCDCTGYRTPEGRSEYRYGRYGPETGRHHQ